MSNQIIHPAPVGGVWYAYPYSKGNFDDWGTDAIELLDPEDVGLYTGTAASGTPHAIFPQSTAPTSWDQAEAEWLGSPSFLVVPGISQTTRAEGPNLEAFIGETIEQQITFFQEDGSTALSLAGKTLKLIFSNANRGVIHTYNDGDLTVSGEENNILAFNWNISITRTDRTGFWALRDDSENENIRNGTFEIRYAPQS